MQVAEESYRALIEERWEDYLECTAAADSLPAAIRKERIDMLQEYMAMEHEMRGGLLKASAIRDTLVGDDHAFVFLKLQWADSTCEEVMVPMIRVGDGWKIR